MDVGIKYGISFADYRKIDAINISTLCRGFASAEHIKAALDGRMVKKDTKDMKFGRGIHAAILEPDVYAEEFTINPLCEEPLKSGDRKGKPCGVNATYRTLGEDRHWFCGKHIKGKAVLTPENVITQEFADRIQKAIKKIRSHKVMKLIRLRGGYETTLIFEIEGALAKARLDKLSLPKDNIPAVITDIKKVQSGGATKDKFEKACWDYYYDAKAAWYVDAVKILTGFDCAFVWVVIEDDEPFGLRVVEANKPTLAAGRIRYHEVLGMYQHGMRTEEWPGYSNNDIEMGGLSAYHLSKMLGQYS